MSAAPSAIAPRPPHSHDPYASLRHRDFLAYVIGNFLATVGSQMQTVAVGWEVYERTRSTLDLGFVGLSQFLPILFFFLPAGHVADRFERRWVLVATLSLSAVASLGLAAISLSGAPVGLVYVMLFVNGVARSFAQPARTALPAQLVPRELYANAATWRSSSWQLAAVLGPSLGGAMIGAFRSATPVFFVAAVMALVFVALAALMARRPVQPTGAANWETLSAGLTFVWRTKMLLAAITLDLFAVLFGGVDMLMPAFARDILHVGPTGLGWMLAAPSTGAVLMALVLAHRPPMERAGRALLVAVTGFGLATIVFGLSRWFPLSLAALVVLGAFDMVSVVIRATLVQVVTPDEMRGRVGAVDGLFTGTSNELGGFESGAVAALVGPVGSVILGGIGTLVVVATVAWRFPQVRRLGRLT